MPSVYSMDVLNHPTGMCLNEQDRLPATPAVQPQWLSGRNDTCGMTHCTTAVTAVQRRKGMRRHDFVGSVGQKRRAAIAMRASRLDAQTHG